MTGMITTAIPAAISPYSMAVAPDSSRRKAISWRRIPVVPSPRRATTVIY